MESTLTRIGRRSAVIAGLVLLATAMAVSAGPRQPLGSGAAPPTLDRSPLPVDGPPTPVAGTPRGGQLQLISGVTADDGQNSMHAHRLVDGVAPPGTGDSASWLNPQPWQASSYPMTAVLDLGGHHRLRAVSYFVGNISQGSDQVRFEYSTDVSGPFLPLLTVDSGHQWNKWRTAPVDGPEARRIRIRFDSPSARFNISELRIYAKADTPTVIPPTTIVPPTTLTPTTIPASSTTTTPASSPTTTPASSTTTTPASSTTTTPASSTTLPPSQGGQPQAGPPPAGIVRSHGFGNWPTAGLSQACIDAHDSYWRQGYHAHPDLPADHAENQAYHTWHPAVITVPGTGEICRIPHEHGINPELAPIEVFERAGGHPAFGYVAAVQGGHRHEDHVSYKATVARYRAAIGNGAGTGPLYDAGFECDWSSVIHQGGHSLDSFSNHAHEYHLTVRCLDGLNAAGQVDNTVVGTDFSVKVLYTYGRPNEFVENGCTTDDPATAINESVFPSSIVTGPEGQQAPAAHLLTPVGEPANNREFVCASGVIWKDLSQLISVDLWTQLVRIEDGDGQQALAIQPYYINKIPSRIVAPYDGAAGEQPTSVIRTIGLCYGEDGSLLNLPFCDGAPPSEPDWRSPTSPFNNTVRAVNFKAVWLTNESGPNVLCTDPFGRAVDDQPPCASGNVEQRLAPFDNHHNDGQYSYRGRSGNIQGSIWAEDPRGARFEATPIGDGAFQPRGIGFEFVVDNSDPDDDGDGNPDGAAIGGEN